MIPLIALAFALALPAFAHAGAHEGHEGGNGGGAVVCPAGTVSYDLFTALRSGDSPRFREERSAAQLRAISREQELDLIHANLVQALQPMLHFDPTLYHAILDSFFGPGYDAFSELRTYSHFLPHHPIEDLGDAHPTDLPPGCSFHYVVRQYLDPRVVSATSFEIDQDLWDTLDLASRTVLSLHEVLYDFAYLHGWYIDRKDSRDVVRFISHLLSDGFQDISFASYLDMVKESPMGDGRFYLGDLILDVGQMRSPFKLVVPNASGEIAIRMFECRETGRPKREFEMQLVGDFAQIYTDGGAEMKLYALPLSRSLDTPGMPIRMGGRVSRSLRDVRFRLSGEGGFAGVLRVPQLADLALQDYEAVDALWVEVSDREDLTIYRCDPAQ
jgi:hypothetical protein